MPRAVTHPGSTVPLVGHTALRERLADARARGTLPSSILLHGAPGIGKQRLALELAGRILCDDTGAVPCRACQGCRFMAALTHPDLHWVFPRPRPKDSNASPAVIHDDLADAIAARVADGLLYPPAAGVDGIFVATIRMLVRAASISPAIGRRKVIIIGNAERMVPQEGKDEAANTLLKLLEEPPTDTTIVLTSSEPGALLPTIRSRVIAVRVAPVRDADVREFVRHPTVAARLAPAEDPAAIEALIVRAQGAPGTLLGGLPAAQALAAARAILAAADRAGVRTRGIADRRDLYREALRQGSAGARGAYADTLDALGMLLHARARDAVRGGDPRAARFAATAARAIDHARTAVESNGNPQLLTAALGRALVPPRA